MTEKYYTPSIEEFHLGFEYEELIENTWIERVLRESIMYIDNANSKFKGVAFSIEKEPVRVKYLDQEDIESLGWIIEKRFNNLNCFIKNNYVLSLSLTNGSIMIHRKVDNIQELFTDFSGFIKNKSELIRLMKQLNIT